MATGGWCNRVAGGSSTPSWAAGNVHGQDMNEQELLEFVDDNDDDAAAIAGLQHMAPWRVLIVDDDVDVHESTSFGLAGIEIEGRALQLLHAYSGAEALALLVRESDIAVIGLRFFAVITPAWLATNKAP